LTGINLIIDDVFQVSSDMASENGQKIPGVQCNEAMGYNHDKGGRNNEQSLDNMRRPEAKQVAHPSADFCSLLQYTL
jgi:hypothetical protein